MREEVGVKNSVFVLAQGIKNCPHKGWGGDKKWQNSVHVVVECPISEKKIKIIFIFCWFGLHGMGPLKEVGI